MGRVRCHTETAQLLRDPLFLATCVLNTVHWHLSIQPTRHWKERRNHTGVEKRGAVLN